MPASPPFAAQPRHKAHLGVNHVKLAPPSQSLCGAAFPGRAHLSDAEARDEGAEQTSSLPPLAGARHHERAVIFPPPVAPRRLDMIAQPAGDDRVRDRLDDLRRRLPASVGHPQSLHTPTLGHQQGRVALQGRGIAQA